MTIKDIFIKSSNIITTIAEKILIFYPTPKNTRLAVNITYVIALIASCLTILSYDYEQPTYIVNHTSNNTLQIANYSFVDNNLTVTYNSIKEQEIISYPHPLVENKYIRLFIGLVVAYLTISLLYSNTLHTKLVEYDNLNKTQ